MIRFSPLLRFTFERALRLSFQAKVKETEQLFVATNEVDKDRVWSKDAHKLEKANHMSAISFQQLVPGISLSMAN